MHNPAETLFVSFVESGIGLIGIASTPKGVARVSFPLRNRRAFEKLLGEEYRGTRLVDGSRHNARAARQIGAYFSGNLRSFDLPLDLRGTPFQKRVLNAVKRIPFGRTRSYGQIARQVGSPQGARAVGGAVGSNPLPLLVPCHRVIGSTGALVGFGSGIPLKKRLLDMEAGE
jgi:methylated-DNA-[protein]-cysteine S-methyltransferase